MADVHCSVCGHVIADIGGQLFTRLAIGCNECGSTTGVVAGMYGLESTELLARGPSNWIPIRLARASRQVRLARSSSAGRNPAKEEPTRDRWQTRPSRARKNRPTANAWASAAKDELSND